MLHSKKTCVSVNNSNIDNLLKKKYTLYTSENVFKEASDSSSNKKIKTQKRIRGNKKKTLKINSTNLLY